MAASRSTGVEPRKFEPRSLFVRPHESSKNQATISYSRRPDDRFIARTISSGGPLALSDPALIEAVRQTKPVVILDTTSRFLQANDENSAAQNRLLVNDIVALRAAGAVSVIILHHAKKAAGAKREAMTLQNMLRGTTDFGAMCDQ